MFKKILISLTLFSTLSGEPWGKDADLIFCNPCSKGAPLPSRDLAAEGLIWFHKKVISPADGPRSHHKPNSSQYTLDAMHAYGFYWGFLMGCDRLMRENDDPWIYKSVLDESGDIFKWDPVP